MKFIRSLMMLVVVASATFSVSGFAESATQKITMQKTATAQVAEAPVAATVNINTADAETIADRLNGVGIKKAQAIVSFRDQHGPFKSVDDLVNVTGIGGATLERNRSIISVN